ncbi:MAG: DUF481 domain-containing protein [Verrucomicrobia bacterium]|nr:DUF481 domain-containing protein [Verrucomicrobiota bacterium]NBY37150.1 DUF481 domain-containing protein [Verrucomicrobiota bacterium]
MGHRETRRAGTKDDRIEFHGNHHQLKSGDWQPSVFRHVIVDVMRLTFLLLLPFGLWADTVTLTDGTFLHGKIERVAGGFMEVVVPKLGAAIQRIPITSVESFNTDDAVIMSGGGTVLRGKASVVAQRAASTGGAETLPFDARLELWRDANARPADIVNARKWTMLADLDLSGRSGVTEGSGISAGFLAKGITPQDTIIGSVRATQAKSGNQTSANDLHVNLSYETNPTGVVFWYVRTDTGYDKARMVDLLSVNAGGIGLRLFTDASGKLDARLGLAHRYENYSIAGQPSLSTPSADLGLILHRELGWAALDSSISVVPSFSDSANYYIRHESSLNIMRREGPLSLKIGLSNDFRGRPLPTQASLDTAYFARIVYAVK